MTRLLAASILLLLFLIFLLPSARPASDRVPYWCPAIKSPLNETPTGDLIGPFSMFGVFSTEPFSGMVGRLQFFAFVGFIFLPSAEVLRKSCQFFHKFFFSNS